MCKVKVAPLHAAQAKITGTCTCTALLHPNLGTDEGEWVVYATPRPVYPKEHAQYPF